MLIAFDNEHLKIFSPFSKNISTLSKRGLMISGVQSPTNQNRLYFEQKYFPLWTKKCRWLVALSLPQLRIVCRGFYFSTFACNAASAALCRILAITCIHLHRMFLQNAQECLTESKHAQDRVSKCAPSRQSGYSVQSVQCTVCTGTEWRVVSGEHEPFPAPAAPSVSVEGTVKHPLPR